VKDEDPMGIRDHHKIKKLDQQMDQVIMANLSFLYFGANPDAIKAKSPEKKKARAAESDYQFDESKSDFRKSEKSHSGLSYLSKSNINEQWYKFIFDDKDTLSALDRSQNSYIESPSRQSNLMLNFQLMKNEAHYKDKNQPFTERQRVTSKSNNTPGPRPLGVSDNSLMEHEGQSDRSSQISNVNRFTLHSNLSQFQGISTFKLQHPNKGRRGFGTSQTQNEINLIKKDFGSSVMLSDDGQNVDQVSALASLLDKLDIYRFIRLSYLLNPIIKSTTIKQRLFRIPKDAIGQLENPIHVAKCLYLSDDLDACMAKCRRYRQIYTSQKSLGFKKNDFELISSQIAVIYILELACLREKINQKEGGSEELLRLSHTLLESIPIIVKSREQHQFTIMELLLKHKENRALSKLKDIDFISFKLFRTMRLIQDDSNNCA
jgi:hypothetical protein